MPHRDLYCSEASEILSKVSELIANSIETSAKAERQVKYSGQRWVTTLFVQLAQPVSGNGPYQDEILDEYRAIIERSIGHHHGDVVALSHDAALALFMGDGHPQEHTQDGVNAATSLLDQIGQLNIQRLTQYLAPLRIGIGLDAGVLNVLGCNRHPLLDPGLEGYLKKVRRLSDLNCQTPFPAIFISHTVADRLNQDQRYSIQCLGDVFVENQADPIVVYALMNGETVPK